MVRVHRWPTFVLFLLAATFAGGTAVAAPVGASTPAKGTVTIIHPLTLLKTVDMDFGLLTSGPTAGSAAINPNSGALTVTGGVGTLGGAPHPATFVGAASGLSLIYIQQPTAAITLTRAGGTETLSASNFTVQGGNFRIATAAGAFSFQVGATLNVPAGQIDGLYTGTFTVDAYYF